VAATITLTRLRIKGNSVPGLYFRTTFSAGTLASPL
jgi:hypothetical protein